jgi:hypothetical protein
LELISSFFLRLGADMETLSSILLVFMAGLLELWMAIPLGLALKLPPITVAFISALGSITAVFLVILVSAPLRDRFLKWRYGEVPPKSRALQIWNRYGVVGLGLLSPLIFGALLGTAVGIALGAEKKYLLLWMTVGIAMWSVALTAGGFFGLLSFNYY